jgi:hypothetical protein
VRKNGHRGRRVSGTVPAGKDLLKRGVWQAPFLGEDGEMILVAVKRDGRLLCPPVTIPHGGSRVEAGDALFDRLDTADPIPALMII